MPYLARSAFADFPLGNGVVHTVKIPLDGSGGAATNEVATRFARRRSGAGVGCESRAVAARDGTLNDKDGRVATSYTVA